MYTEFSFDCNKPFLSTRLNVDGDEYLNITFSIWLTSNLLLRLNILLRSKISAPYLGRGSESVGCRGKRCSAIQGSDKGKSKFCLQLLAFDDRLSLAQEVVAASLARSHGLLSTVRSPMVYSKSVWVLK